MWEVYMWKSLEQRIREKAYDIWKTNEALGIKADDVANWVRAEEQVAEEDRQEVNKYYRSMEEDWL
jgi:hypothetical protein